MLLAAVATAAASSRSCSSNRRCNGNKSSSSSSSSGSCSSRNSSSSSSSTSSSSNSSISNCGSSSSNTAGTAAAEAAAASAAAMAIRHHRRFSSGICRNHARSRQPLASPFLSRRKEEGQSILLQTGFKNHKPQQMVLIFHPCIFGSSKLENLSPQTRALNFPIIVGLGRVFFLSFRRWGHEIYNNHALDGLGLGIYFWIRRDDINLTKRKNTHESRKYGRG